MRGDDDEEEESSVNATRYPCMPSLVALQQMRNRLHLAHLGKKLMKWTAMATGRELRRLACEIDETYKNFAEDMRSAFMLLARGRYFYPHLNNIVLENVELNASVLVSTSTKAISGVKVLQLEVIESGIEPYEHLGIEKGGQTIHVAKIAWRNLLKRLIMMLQQRTSFYQLELAHKSATKRWNVLRKIVIPRLTNTIKYVICEIDEIEREDMFRLKRFKQMKAKKKGVADEHVCTCCRAMLAEDEKVVETVCPLCKKAEKNKRKPLELTINLVPCKSEDNLQENRKRLEHLMSHIDDVIDLSRQYEMEGIISPSIEKFIKSCNQVKEKIEDYANAQPLCDLCRKALGGKPSASQTGTSKSINLTCSSDRPTEEPPCLDSTYNYTPETDDKLGHFEKKFKEIVKVTRLQNEDGTISEEKQVITIKTERRNPRKPKTFDKIGSSEIFETVGGGGSFRGDGGGSYCTGPKVAKSEHICRSQHMSEPKLRSCMSEYRPKSTLNKDEATNLDGGYVIDVKTSKIIFPREVYTNNTQESGKNSSSTSLQTYCPKKSASVCGGEFSQSYLRGLQKPMSNASVQACCKEITVRKPVEDRGTCCLPICKGDEDCPDTNLKQDQKTKTTSTNAVWRDEWTSTSDLNTTPSKASHKTSPAVSFYNKDTERKDPLKTVESCCTIKIIMKPPKVCTFEEKLVKKKPETEGEKDVVLGGSMFEALKRMILPSHTPVPSQAEPTSELEIKNICKNCILKLHSAASSQKSSLSTTKQCQAEVTAPEKSPSCPSCGTLAISTCSDIASSRSIGVGSDTEVCQTCTKSPTPSMHSQKHVCFLSKMSSDSSFLSTCCDLVQAKSQKSVCCAKSKSSTAPCFTKDSATIERSSATNACSRDVATCTKRSTRFDVRPMRKKHTCEKISLKDCSCRSDPYVARNRGQYYKDPRKCQSFHENDYYYFRW